MKRKEIGREISLKEILKGHFLVREGAHKRWRFLLFLTLLALISITSSHVMDDKIREISEIKNENRELKSEYAWVYSQLMGIQLKSSLEEKLSGQGLETPLSPPYELIVYKKRISRNLITQKDDGKSKKNTL